MPTSVIWWSQAVWPMASKLTPGAATAPPVGQGGVLGMPRADGLTDGTDTIQGVRTYDANAGTWTTPDAYAGNVDDPASQKSYMWNGNNPEGYSDPSGYKLTPPPCDSICGDDGDGQNETFDSAMYSTGNGFAVAKVASLTRELALSKLEAIASTAAQRIRANWGAIAADGLASTFAPVLNQLDEVAKGDIGAPDLPILYVGVSLYIGSGGERAYGATYPTSTPNPQGLVQIAVYIDVDSPSAVSALVTELLRYNTWTGVYGQAEQDWYEHASVAQKTLYIDSLLNAAGFQPDCEGLSRCSTQQ